MIDISVRSLNVTRQTRFKLQINIVEQKIWIKIFCIQLWHLVASTVRQCLVWTPDHPPPTQRLKNALVDISTFDHHPLQFLCCFHWGYYRFKIPGSLQSMTHVNRARENSLNVTVAIKMRLLVWIIRYTIIILHLENSSIKGTDIFVNFLETYLSNWSIS